MPTKPKSLMDELDAELKLSPEEKLAMQILAANPKLQERLDKGNELYAFYQGTEPDADLDSDAATREAKQAEAKRVADAAAQLKKSEDDRKAAAAAKPDASAAAATSASGDLAAIEKLFDTKFTELSSKFIPVDKLPEYRQSILADAIRLTDQYAGIRESHRAEFNEALKQDDFEKFVEGQTKNGAKFPTLNAAYDSFIGEKRIEKRIADGVKAGLKQKTSADSVPGQTPASGMAPARAQIIKARATAAGKGDGTSSMESAVAKLRALNQNREDSVAD